MGQENLLGIMVVFYILIGVVFTQAYIPVKLSSYALRMWAFLAETLFLNMIDRTEVMKEGGR